MKSFFKSTLIVFFCNSFFVGCYIENALYLKADSDKWLEYELAPSKVIKSGNSFFNGHLGGDNSSFFVFYDQEFEGVDGQYYYNIHMQSRGWSRVNKDNFEGYGAQHPKNGHIYINPKRRVAIYYHPVEDISIFKVDIIATKRENSVVNDFED